MHWYTGCSGFHYKEWKGLFYPEKLPQRQWFEYYSSRFHTLELNVSFYRFPQLSFLQNWYDKSPGNFLFSVKAPRLITHYKQFKDTAQLLEDFYTIIRTGLRNKLGAVLFQLPPQHSFNEEKLQHIIKSVDKSFENVIEFRHASWWQKEVIAELGRHQITFCGLSYPGLSDEAIVNTPVVYYRFHGVPHLYHSSYPEIEMDQVAETINKKEKVKKVYLYFNNTADGAAIQNALYMEKFISGSLAAV